MYANVKNGCQRDWQIRTLKMDDLTVGVLVSNQWNQ